MKEIVFDLQRIFTNAIASELQVNCKQNASENILPRDSKIISLAFDATVHASLIYKEPILFSNLLERIVFFGGMHLKCLAALPLLLLPIFTLLYFHFYLYSQVK